ncbi:glutamate--cysteine ligase [Specibacter sp. RAF43]|uniref:glutamate--cysteine ligase n=1 Tax=Specibacter sp. RAF43 TaxID=3233057 RepID=UPI003F956C63
MVHVPADPSRLHRGQRTIGVEEEFLLIDGSTGKPAAVAETLMILDGKASGPTPLSMEVKLEQLEVCTPVCTGLDDLASAIRQGRKVADAAAQFVGARAVAMATCIDRVCAHTFPVPRYLAMDQRFGLTLREQLTCGYHIHVGVASAAEGIAVLDRIRPWLPVLLALSANSPFWQGTDTGYESYRYQVWNRLPTAGPYDVFGSVANYRRLVRSLLAANVPLDEGMIYFDARLSRRYPTVELRIADVCLDPNDALALAGLARALVQTAVDEWRSGEPPASISSTEMRLASWRASKSGVEGELLHPVLRRPCAAPEAVGALMGHLKEALETSGDGHRVGLGVARILARGTGSSRQRKVLRESESFLAVVQDALEGTHSMMHAVSGSSMAARTWNFQPPTAVPTAM